jgi:amidase
MDRRRSHFDAALATTAETVAAVRKKKISARELLNITFERIDRHNPALNAIVWQCREQAMARAKQADAALARGKAAGALHGVPVTIKESFAYQGSPNTWGLPALKDAKSPRTAVAVERLESAGAIVIGKTNLPVMLADYQSYNPMYGTTNNPWDLARTPGGSTGGGAAAIAAGLGSLTIGTDLSGSTRIPAHFSGVYGHKPSLELVSTAGHQPGPWDGSPGYPMDLTVVGVLTRGARDLALALDVLGGPNGDEPKAWTWHMPPPRHKRIKDFRIGYVFDDEAAPVASDIRRLYDNAIRELKRAGAKVAHGWPPGVDPQAQVKTFQFLLLALVNADVNRPEQESHARWLQETQRRLVFRALWQKYFEHYDVFLLPAAFTAAFPHDHSEPIDKRVIDTPDGKRPYLSLGYWITSATVAGVPATVAPIGFTDRGLPVGIQIVAPMWEDGTSIEFAALLSDIIGGFSAPPPFRE